MPRASESEVALKRRVVSCISLFYSVFFFFCCVNSQLCLSRFSDSASNIYSFWCNQLHRGFLIPGMIFTKSQFENLPRKKLMSGWLGTTRICSQIKSSLRAHARVTV